MTRTIAEIRADARAAYDSYWRRHVDELYALLPEPPGRRSAVTLACYPSPVPHARTILLFDIYT